jgi:hypothetical protein
MNSADGSGLTTWLASAEGAESGARSPNLGLAPSQRIERATRPYPESQLANKIVRIAWVLMTGGERYRA